MVSNQGSGKPTTRRYSPEEKAAAVRMVRTLRAELGCVAKGVCGTVAESCHRRPSARQRKDELLVPKVTRLHAEN